MQKKVEEVAATKKSKARSREGEVKGQWWPCTTTEDELRSFEAEGFLKPGSWRVVPGALCPAPEARERVLTRALVERGFSLPPSDFFSEILEAYKLQPHNISPNSVLAIANHVALCEGHLRVKPDLALFQYFFSVKKETVPQTSSLATCGSITFKIRPGHIYPHTDRHESVRYWSGGFFYVKDVSDPASPKTLSAFKDGPASETPAWTNCPHISESPMLTRMVRRICKLTESGLSGKDLTLSWFTKRIQPLQHRDRLMYEYSGRDDTMRVTKDNLSSDALDKWLQVMIKIPCDVHSHACHFDIYTDGAGTALDSLEEKDLGTLTRVPHTGTTNPEAASDAEIPDAAPPAKRKRGAASGSTSKRARDTLSVAATKKLEKEKQRLKEIDTGRSSQASIERFFNKPSKAAGSKPQKKKLKPSPASMPVTPEVEVPPKPSSSTAQDPKNVINIDDIPTPTADSGKDASSSKPPPEEPESTSAEAPANDAEKKLLLTGATVWGSAETEQQDLATLEDNLRVFFVKHKAVRQNTRQPHEDLRTLVLEQKSEIERLNKKEAEDRQAIIHLETRLKNNEELLANRPSIDEISARLTVLETEHESLQQSLKESYERETRTKKELEEKHTQAMMEMAEKLKASNSRAKTLSSKLKAAEAEAADVDELIFPCLGFEWKEDNGLSRTEAYEEARNSIDDLIEACRTIAQKLSLKKARTTVIDTMTLMKLVPDLIGDWKESSARGAAACALAMCKAHFPAINFATIARGVPKATNVKLALAETQGFDTLFSQ
ncbi:hypothetical protein QYE76_048782 [Lolium multiflorum]|uniref:Transposase (putative) gypsy type domain-containing protein n=1 Tax=Lolium multiflorum TaxID=4521 RepID=A0AAD8WHM3_LOLMU|nr:hypothetical protein QYE76_048782 [Lolium multiflorum]